ILPPVLRRASGVRTLSDPREENGDARIRREPLLDLRHRAFGLPQRASGRKLEIESELSLRHFRNEIASQSREERRAGAAEEEHHEEHGSSMLERPAEALRIAGFQPSPGAIEEEDRGSGCASQSASDPAVGDDGRADHETGEEDEEEPDRPAQGGAEDAEDEPCQESLENDASDPAERRRDGACEPGEGTRVSGAVPIVG